jgi:hypothetical protein
LHLKTGGFVKLHKAGGILKAKIKRNVLRIWSFWVVVEVYRWKCLVLGYK